MTGSRFHTIKINTEAYDTLAAILRKVVVAHELVVRIGGQKYMAADWDYVRGLFVHVLTEDTDDTGETRWLGPDELTEMEIH